MKLMNMDKLILKTLLKFKEIGFLIKIKLLKLPNLIWNTIKKLILKKVSIQEMLKWVTIVKTFIKEIIMILLLVSH